MKTTIVFLLLMISLSLSAQNASDSVWRSSYYSLDSFKVEMNQYKGKKLIVAVVDASNPDVSQLAALDKLNRSSNGAFNVLGVLVSDFSTPKKRDALLGMIKTTSALSFPLTEVTRGKIASGPSQHLLLKWVTSPEVNVHFKADIIQPGQLFVISSKGILYAVLYNDIDVNGAAMKQILKTEPEQ